MCTLEKRFLFSCDFGRLLLEWAVVSICDRCLAISFLILGSCVLLLLAPLIGFIFAYPLLFIISLVPVDVVSRIRRAFLLLSAFPVVLTGLVTVPVMLKGAFLFELFMMGIWGIASLSVSFSRSESAAGFGTDA